MRTEGKFVTGSIWRHIIVMTTTSSVALLTTFLVDLVDILFILHLGDSALAAGVGFAASILYFVRSISVALSISTGVLVSRAIGARRKRQAARYAGNASLIALMIVASVVLIVASGQHFLLTAVGAQGATLRAGEQYLSIVLCGSVLLCLGMCGGAIIRANGGATASMVVSLSGSITNAILDPIFIFVCGWGLQGAAWATVISQLVFCGGAWGMIFWRYRLATPLRWRFLRADWRDVMRVAVPMMFTSLSAPLTTAFAARQMARFGTESIAGFVVIMRVTPVAFAMTFSLSGAIAPIIGQNAGARRFERAKETLKNALQFNWLTISMVCVVLFLLRDALPHWFALSPAATALLQFYCDGVALFFGCGGMVFCCNAAFNNLGRPLYSTTANFARLFCGSLPMITVAGYFFGARGVVFGFVAEGLFVAPVSCWVAFRLLQAYAHGLPLQTQRGRDFVAGLLSLLPRGGS